QRFERTADQVQFRLVLGSRQHAAHQPEAAVDQPGIDDVGFAIGAHFFPPARVPRLPYQAAVHAQFAGEAAELGQLVQWRIGASIVFGQQVHQVAMPVVVAADVIAVAEVAIVFAHVPISRGLDAVYQAAVMQYGQVESRSVPADELGRIAVDGLEEARDQRGFGIVGLAYAFDPESLVVAKDAADHRHLVQVEREEIVSHRFASGSSRPRDDLGVRYLVSPTVELAQALHVGDGFQVEDQHGRHGGPQRGGK